ncbi:HAD family hydrolase [Microbacteriaceae bacterium VKM Ac-2855]|nr:HAD family hydrolase [Microbacteriaceae bacterium VKM Ac-2855]
MTDRRLIFIDVDGTLIDSHHRLAPGARDAVRAARSRGHLVFLATGRSVSEIPEEVTEIGFDGVVSAGGGFAEWGDTLVAEHLIAPKEVQDIIDVLDAHGCGYRLQGRLAIQTSRGLAEVLASVPNGIGAIAPGAWNEIERTEQIDVSAVAKVLFLGSVPGVFGAVKRVLGERFHLITGSIPALTGQSGEITARGVTKATAVVDLAERLGIDLGRVVAIGDSANDVEMFDVAGTAIAMTDAPAEVRARADTVTESVAVGGVANALVRLGVLE